MPPLSAYAIPTTHPLYASPIYELPWVPQAEDTPVDGHQVPADELGIEGSPEDGVRELNEDWSWQPWTSWQHAESIEYYALIMLLNDGGGAGHADHLDPADHPGPSLLPPQAVGVKRNSPRDGAEEQVERPLKMARVAPSADPEVVNLTSDEYYEGLELGPAHLDNGKIEGMYHCSCGISYTRKSSLNRHLEIANGSARYICSICPETFKRNDTRLRHERNAHLGEKWPCPWCFRTFRADYINQHLRSKGNGCHEALLEALHVQCKPEVQPLTDADYQQHWNAGLTGGQPGPHLRPAPPTSDLDKQTIGLDGPAAKFLQEHPPKALPAAIPRRSRAPCNICGESFGPDEDDLIKHVHLHSMELATNSFRCEECCIDFAFKKDLDRHRVLAASGHCGLNFYHSRACHGHHDVGTVDSRQMKWRLEAWETSQIRAHRLAIIQLLLERSAYRRAARFSMNDCVSQLSYPRPPDRFSKISVKSFKSVPAWVKTGEDDGLEEFARQFGLLDTAGTNRPSMNVPSRPRPDSMVLDMHSDMPLKLHRLPVPPSTYNAQADTNLPRHSTYARVASKLRKSTESTGSLQRRFFQAANNVAKLVKTSNGHGREWRHIGSTVR